eukprot:g6313.t1
MLSGRLPVVPPSSSSGNVASLGGSRGSSMAYRVPPNEFLKVLVEGNTTRIGGLHAVLQAIGRGDLQGRAASLCISEVRMCLSACADSSGPGDDDRRSASTILRRMPLAQLRELAGVCLSFSMDVPSVARAPGDRPATGVYAGGRRGAEDANNRRILMLEALPAVLGACFAVAVAGEEEDGGTDEDDDNHDDRSSESDSDRGEEEADEPMVERRRGGKGGRASVSAAAAAGKNGKGKGKSGGSNDGRRWSTTSAQADGSMRKGTRHNTHSKTTANGGGGGGFGRGGLPEQGEAILRDVTDALLHKPWPLRLVLPLLVLFEEIYGLVELLDGRARQPATESVIGETARGGSVWARVRSRLMETVCMGGLDGADFTGVVRQVCVLCDTDGRRNYEGDAQCSLPRLRQELPDGHVAVRAATVHQTEDGALSGGEQGEEVGAAEKPPGEQHGLQLWGTASGSDSWLSCLRQLYAAVPPEWVSTVELVLEQTLHQMPGVAESLLDAIQDSSGCSISSSGGSSSKGGEADCSGSSGRNVVPSRGQRSDYTPTSSGNDLALLILLLREASPLRACSLPLLPVGVDRGRRAEEGVRRLLLQAGRCDFGGTKASVDGKDRMAVCPGRVVALGGARALLGEVLCSESGFAGNGGSGGEGYRGPGGGGSSSRGVSGGGGGSESSGVVPERASQLLELALRWLEEGDGGDVVGGDGGAVYGKDGDGTECRRLAPHSQGVSDALGRLTLLPRGRARRVVESMLPLADVCSTQASALINLCRKCSVQGESKGRLLTLHAVTCILAWNSRRAKSGRGGGCLDLEGMQEDLVGMFRRAFESGLQTAARADALHLLATKLATPSLEDAGQPTAFAEGSTAPTSETQRNGGLLPAAPSSTISSLPPPRAALGREPLPSVGLSALSDLREFLTARLFRFFVPKDEVLDADPGAAGRGDGGYSRGVDRRAAGGPDSTGRGKGKQRARRRRGGRLQLVPLRLLEERAAPGAGRAFGENSGSGKGHGVVRNARGRGVVARDPIGHLLKCCWALVPAAQAGPGPVDDAHGGVVSDPGKREEAEAIARAVLGTGRQRGGEGGRLAKGGLEIRTREGEALVAVVEFLQRGGGMETLRVVTPPNQGTACSLEAHGDIAEPPALPPPTCHPGVVSPLTALGVVVTLAEALVDCILSGSSCPPAIPALPPTVPCEDDDHHHRNASSGEPIARKRAPLVLWAVADVFTLLAAATRAADNIAGPAGFFTKHPKARTPESLSEIVVSLPAETLALSRGSELNSTVGGADDEDEEKEGEVTARRSNRCGGRREREGRGGGGGGDPVAQCTLLSPASALVFVREFLEWAASEAGKSPAALVGQGWDGGIGVWLGLIHSVQTLARALRNATGNSVGRHRDCTGGVSSRGRAAVDGGPSAEAIALAIFQLRTAVGTPSAALHALDPSAAGLDPPLSHEEVSTGTSHPPLADGDSIAGNNARGEQGAEPPRVRCVSRRPPPGAMITGFLKRMSERWKAALPWGLPSAAPPRRASPRLERRSERPGGGGFGGENAPKSLKTEAEDLFFALRGELLRAERLVLSILLVGPGATLATRAWTMRAALLSGRSRRLGEQAVGVVGLGGRLPPPVTAVEAAAPRVRAKDQTGPPHALPTGEEPPESGSGPSLAAPRVNRSKTRPVTLKAAARTGGRRSCVPAAEAEELARQPSGDQGRDRGKGDGFAGAVAPREDGEEGDWEGLGSLCRLAATEMREGLEDGLSVKLSQAYLDLIELLGNAALQHQHQAWPTTTRESFAAIDTATVPRLGAEKGPPQASAGSFLTHGDGVIDNGERLGEDAGDAGGVLLSIVTCHAVAQHSLFKRLISGGVRFDGVGISRHLQASRTTAATLAALQARDHELSRTVVGYGSRKVVSSVEPCPGSSNDRIAAMAATELETLRAMPRSPPPPLERSARLVIHCVRWIRARHGSRRARATMPMFEDGGVESSEEADVGASGGGGDGGNGEDAHTGGCGYGDDDVGLPERESDGPQSRYSFSPEEVKFVSSRECFVAMRAALVECEAALSSASSGLDVRGGGGRSSTDGDLADVLATVSFGLREFFAPAVVTAAQTAKQASTNREKTDSAGNSATVAGPPSASAPAGQCGERRNGGCKTKGAAGGASPLAALDVFPDTVKLLLMRVLERLYLVGRGFTLAASSILAKPSSAAVATAGKTQAASSPSLPAPPPPPPLTSSGPSPPPSKRRRHQRATGNAGKPGDQAGGAPANERETWTTERRRGDGGPTAVRAVPPATGSAWLSLRSRSASSSSAHQCRGSPQGDVDDHGADASSTSVSGLSTSGSVIKTSKVPEGPANPMLAPLLPAAALASGDGLHLMLAARIWAEALRSRNQRDGDDPCRKRASTMLFKIERCELEIGTAAHRARQFLEHFEEGAKHSAVGAGTRDGRVGSAKKRGRGCFGNDGGRGGGGGQAKARDAAIPMSGKCDETVVNALGLLLSGADTLAAWRRDSAAKEKNRAARLNREGKRGQGRRGQQQGRGAAEADDAGEEGVSERRGDGVRDRFGGASGKRRRSRGARVRSRNVVIDGWLAEGGEEGGSREDAFVDLEDFIEA